MKLNSTLGAAEICKTTAARSTKRVATKVPAALRIVILYYYIIIYCYHNTKINVCGLLSQNTFLAQINTTERTLGKNIKM